MENLDLNAKKLEPLTDEELMEVVGGEKYTDPTVVQRIKDFCRLKSSFPKCKAEKYCVWINGGCWPDPNQFAY
mgnify:CR=1 FL=1